MRSNSFSILHDGSMSSVNVRCRCVGSSVVGACFFGFVCFVLCIDVALSILNIVRPGGSGVGASECIRYNSVKSFM